MEEKKITGPLLTDAEFFEELDIDIPQLKEARETFLGGDVRLAYHLFAEYVRATFDIDEFCKKKGCKRRPEFTDGLKDSARKALDHYMVSVNVPMQFGKEIDWEANPTYNNYLEWPWQLSRHAEIAVLANAYRATDDEKYAAEAVYMLISWIRQAVRTEYDASPYHNTLTWRTIECGIRMQKWPMIVYSIARSPSFTDDACVMIFKSFYEHGMRLSSRYTHGNWLFIELGGMADLSCFITVFKKSKLWRDGVADKLTGCLKSQTYPDSSQYELAPSYQGVAMSCACNVERTFAGCGYTFPEIFYEKINEMCEYFVKMRMADGYVPPINDSVKCHAVASIERYVNNYGGHALGRWLCGKEGATAPDFNTCVLPYAGFVAFRTGWGEGDVSAFFDAGKFGRDHHHEDRLNFLLYSSDQPLVYEMGTYAYDKSPMRCFATQSHGHNVILVDGLGQNRYDYKAWNEESYIPVKEDLRYYADDGLEYAVGYYNGAYGNPAYDGEGVSPRHLAIHMRHILMLRGDKPQDTLFVVYDRMLSNDAHTYSTLWHLNVDEVELYGNNATCPHLTVLTGGFDSMECDTGVSEPKPRGWISRTNFQGDYYPAPQLTLSKRGACTETVTLFAIGHKDNIAVDSVECGGGCVRIGYKNGNIKEINVTELHGKATIQ